jgi:hypothetical protein
MKRTSREKVSWIHTPYLRLKVAVTNTVPLIEIDGRNNIREVEYCFRAQEETRKKVQRKCRRTYRCKYARPCIISTKYNAACLSSKYPPAVKPFTLFRYRILV